MGTSGRRAGLALGVLILVTGAAVTNALTTREPAGPDPAEPQASPSSTGRAAPRPEGPPALLPNLRSLAAGDLQVQPIPGGGRLLRFSASLANLGPGPLRLRPRPGGGVCPPGQQLAQQVLHGDRDEDGAYQPARDVPGRARDAGCMLAHPTHDHWHFDAMAGYSLRALAGRSLASRPKVSFCLRDNSRAPGVETDVRREHFGECRRKGPQGISPGWVDIYLSDLPGQALRLPPGPGRRTLCLDLTADPDNLIVETDETDNGTSVAVVVTGDVARRGPTGRCGSGRGQP